MRIAKVLLNVMQNGKFYRVGRATSKTSRNLVRSFKRDLTSFACSNHMINIPDFTGQDRNINAIWLRENCQCSECYSHSTNQRHVVFDSFDANVKPTSQHVDGAELRVNWSDGHESVYSTEWLEKHLIPEQSKIQKVFWDGSTMSETKLTPQPYKDYMNDDAALSAMLSDLIKYGFGLVQQTPADEAHTEQVVERVSFMKETFFGKMCTFTADLAHSDTAYTNIALGAHTDTTYLDMPSGIQVFHCLYHDGKGGSTLLVDGFNACEMLRKESLDAFKLLSETRIEHEYREPGVHMRSLDSVINVHPRTGELRRLRYNHYDRSPISTMDQTRVGEYYEALRLLTKHVENSANEFWIKLKPGTVLFIDNWRVMHGRSGFDGKRVMTSCYLPRDDWLSKARVLKCF